MIWKEHLVTTILSSITMASSARGCYLAGFFSFIYLLFFAGVMQNKKIFETIAFLFLSQQIFIVVHLFGKIKVHNNCWSSFKYGSLKQSE